MPRPTRTIDNLIGRKVRVWEKHLLTRKAALKRAFFSTATCKITKVKTNKSGLITHIYVVRGVTQFDKRTGKFKVKKWLKTPKRISVDYCTQDVTRIRREGNKTFQWQFPKNWTVTTKAGVQWEGGMAPIAWWLNNQDLMPYEKTKRIDLNKKPAAPMFNLRF